MPERFALLTACGPDPVRAKTAVALLRFRPDDVAAVIDPDATQPTADALFGQGGDVPVATSVEAAARLGADTLVVGVTTAGGTLPPTLRAPIEAALRRGWSVVSGLHDALAGDPQLAALANTHGGSLTDLRHTDWRGVSTGQDLRDACYRVHTVGNDCSVGKMLVSVELTRAWQRRGTDAAFVATGQTGMLLADPAHCAQRGRGLPIDAVVSDFVNGAAEELVRRYQHHDTIVVEGQGSLAHPAYSAVTLGLLHGTRPDALVLCYEPARPHMHGRPHWPVPDLAAVRTLNETLANTLHPCTTVAVALNARRLSDTAYAAEQRRVGDACELPAVDVVREGPGVVLDALDAHRAAIGKT